MPDNLMNLINIFGSKDTKSTTNVDNFGGNGKNIEEKKEVAEHILEKLKESRGMIGKLKLNIFGGRIKDYLVSEGIGDTINDGIKGIFLNSVLNDKSKFTIDGKEYTSIFGFLEAAKKAITHATQADLVNLKNQIDLGSGDAEDSPNDNNHEQVHSNTEVNKIIETLKTKGQLTNIKEVKDSEGNIIIEGIGKTPYFNENAIGDLVSFALAFYKKTGKALNIVSAYRTISHQKDLEAKNKNKSYVDNNGITHTGVPTAKPGYSNHQTGHAIDISSDSIKLLSTAELLAIAKANNFKRDENEPWHFNHRNMLARNVRLASSTKLDKNYESYWA